MRVSKENVPKHWVFSITRDWVFCTLKTFFLQWLKSVLFFLLAKEPPPPPWWHVTSIYWWQCIHVNIILSCDFDSCTDKNWEVEIKFSALSFHRTAGIWGAPTIHPHHFIQCYAWSEIRVSEHYLSTILSFIIHRMHLITNFNYTRIKRDLLWFKFYVFMKISICVSRWDSEYIIFSLLLWNFF